MSFRYLPSNYPLDMSTRISEIIANIAVKKFSKKRNNWWSGICTTAVMFMRGPEAPKECPACKHQQSITRSFSRKLLVRPKLHKGSLWSCWSNYPLTKRMGQWAYLKIPGATALVTLAERNVAKLEAQDELSRQSTTCRDWQEAERDNESELKLAGRTIPTRSV